MPTGGPASGQIVVKKGHQARSKKPTQAERFRSLLVALGGGVLRFRVVAAFRVVPEHPAGLADDDATTTTRTTKPASYAPARPVPRVRLVCDGHGASNLPSSPSSTAVQRSNRHRRAGRGRRQHDDDDPDGATSESPALAELDFACADQDASAASAALLPRAEGGYGRPRLSQAATAATADPSKRQLTVAESFQRTTRHITGDPGVAARPPRDAPPLIPAAPDPS